MDYAIRISLPYDDLKGDLQKWVDRCSAAICYEHEADDEVARTHVHVALIECQVKTEALKRMCSVSGKGNQFWSFSELRDKDKYMTYMTKGTLRPKLVKLFSHEEVEKSRQAWVEPIGNDKTRADPTEYMIQKVLEVLDTRRDVYSNSDGESLLDDVRSATMKVYWGETRRVPHATQYKIVASTVYLRVMEKFDRLDEGISHIKYLWY